MSRRTAFSKGKKNTTYQRYEKQHLQKAQRTTLHLPKALSRSGIAWLAK